MKTNDSSLSMKAVGSDAESTVPFITMTVAVGTDSQKEITTDGKRLRQLIRLVKRLIDKPSWPQRRGQLFITLLRKLRDQLAIHFALEETCGYFDDSVGVAPELACLAGALRAEHALLFTQISSIVEQLNGMPFMAIPHVVMARTVSRTRAFCDQLQRHESRESDLIMRAYYDDIGVGD